MSGFESARSSSLLGVLKVCIFNGPPLRFYWELCWQRHFQILLSFQFLRFASNFDRLFDNCKIQNIPWRKTKAAKPELKPDNFSHLLQHIPPKRADRLLLRARNHPIKDFFVPGRDIRRSVCYKLQSPQVQGWHPLHHGILLCLFVYLYADILCNRRTV